MVNPVEWDMWRELPKMLLKNDDQRKSYPSSTASRYTLLSRVCDFYHLYSCILLCSNPLYHVFPYYSPFPPKWQKGHFAPDESHVGPLLKLRHHVVQDAPGGAVEVLLERFQPSWICMTVGHQDHLKPQKVHSYYLFVNLHRSKRSSHDNSKFHLNAKRQKVCNFMEFEFVYRSWILANRSHLHV